MVLNILEGNFFMEREFLCRQQQSSLSGCQCIPHLVELSVMNDCLKHGPSKAWRIQANPLCGCFEVLELQLGGCSGGVGHSI